MTPDSQENNQNLKQTSNKRLATSSFVFLFLTLVGLDQFIKFSADNIYKNYNFAFSIPLPKILMFAVYALVLFFIFKYILRNYHKFNFFPALAWTLIVAGAVANLAERIVLGYVRDFIYIFTGIYNLADGYIIFGIIILLLKAKKPLY